MRKNGARCLVPDAPKRLPDSLVGGEELRWGGGQGAVSRGIESDTEMSHPSPCHVPVGHVPSKIRSLFSKKHHVIIMTPSNINR